MKTLPEIGTLVARVEAPTMRYRVTSTIRHGGRVEAVRLLPYQRSGREVILSTIGSTLGGDGSIWTVVS